MPDSPLVGTWTWSSGIPQLPVSHVRRDTLQQMVTDLAARGTQLIYLDAPAGYGKTTLCSSLARSRDDVLSIFISSADRYSYQPSVITADLCHQLSWALDREIPETRSPADFTLLTSLVHRARQASIKQKRPFLILVDSPTEIPLSESSLLGQLRELLPLGRQGFTIIVTTAGTPSGGWGPPGAPPVTLPVPGFTHSEIQEMFSQDGLAPDQMERIIAASQGKPHTLASIQRVLRSDAIFSLPDALAHSDLGRVDRALFDTEWGILGHTNTLALEILKLVAFAQHDVDLSFLSDYLNASQDSINAAITQVSFLNTSESGKTRLVSDTLRPQLQERLSTHRRDVVNSMADYMLQTRSDPEYAPSLLSYLTETERWPDISSYLTKEQIADWASAPATHGTLRRALRNGLTASFESASLPELIRFGVGVANIEDLATSPAWVDEVEALIALDKFGEALTLATSSPNREDRFQMLATIAAAKRSSGADVENSIATELDLLSKEVSYPSYEAVPKALVTSLFQYKPTFALSYIERMTGSTGSANSIDLAILDYHLEALTKKRTLTPVPADGIEITALHTVAADPSIRTITAYLSAALQEYTYADLTRDLAGADSPAQQLFLLSQWIRTHADSSDAPTALTRSNELLLANAEYVPTATLLYDLSLALPNVTNAPDRADLADRFLQYADSLAGTSPTLPYLQLLLSIWKAQYSCYPDLSVPLSQSIVQLATDALDIADQAQIASWFAAALDEVDITMYLEDCAAIHTSTFELLRSSTSRLLAVAANQEVFLPAIVSALAFSHPGFAIQLALSSNTEQRRIAALDSLLCAISSKPLTEQSQRTLDNILLAISSDADRMSAILHILHHQSARPTELSATFAETLLASLPANTTSVDRFQAYLSTFRILARTSDEGTESAQRHLDAAIDNLMAMPPTPRGAHMAYDACRSTAPTAPLAAGRLLLIAEDIRSRLNYHSHEQVLAASLGIRLTIRAFRGLLHRDSWTPDDVTQLLSLIETIPDITLRSSLLADLAMAASINKQHELFHSIVNQHILPLVQTVQAHDAGQMRQLIPPVSQALFHFSESICTEYIDLLEPRLRDSVLHDLACSLAWGVAIGEPYFTPPSGECDIDYADCLKIVNIANRMEDDHLIYHLIELIASSATSSAGKKRINEIQRIDLAKRLEALSEAKLPYDNGIRHTGYKLAALARAHRLSSTSVATSINEIAKGAADVPNESDSILVGAILAATLYGREQGRAHQLFKEQRVRAEHLPIARERSNLLTQLASLALPHDKSEARQCLVAAHETILTRRGDDLTDVSRRVMDLAYQCEPEFATSLSTLADKDLARSRNVIEMTTRLQHRRAESSLTKLRSNSNRNVHNIEPSILCESAWDALAKLNSGWADPTPPESIVEALKQVSTVPLSSSYPAYCWAIENVNRRRDRSKKTDTLSRELFAALTEMSEVTVSFSSGAILSSDKIRAQQDQLGRSRVFSEGQRDEAIAFLTKLLGTLPDHYLLISEPYFELADLELLRIVQICNPDCHVQIATGVRSLRKVTPSSYREEVMHYWRQHFTFSDPPVTDFYFLASDATKNSPIHDRWWVTDQGGIRLGTSFNALGSGRSTEISELSPEEASQRKFEIQRYLNRTERTFHGSRISTQMFSIPDQF